MMHSFLAFAGEFNLYPTPGSVTRISARSPSASNRGIAEALLPSPVIIIAGGSMYGVPGLSIGI